MTDSSTKRHEKSQYSFTTEDAEHTEEIQIHFTMKCMKMHEGKPGNAALCSGFKAFRLWRPTPCRWITPGGQPVTSCGKQLFVSLNPRSGAIPHMCPECPKMSKCEKSAVLNGPLFSRSRCSKLVFPRLLDAFVVKFQKSARLRGLGSGNHNLIV